MQRTRLRLATYACFSLITCHLFSADDLGDARQNIRSDIPEKFLLGVKTIVRSKDEAAWQDLGGLLTGKDRIEVLEKRRVPKLEISEEGMLPMLVFKDLHTVIKEIAKGVEPYSWKTLIKLSESEVFKHALGSHRNYILYDAFKYVKSHDDAWIEFLKQKLNEKAGDQNLLSLEALISNRSEKAVSIVTDVPDTYLKLEILALYRDTPSNLKALVNVRTKATDSQMAELLTSFIIESKSQITFQAEFRTPRALPAYAAAGADDKKLIATTLTQFLENQGKLPLKEEQRRALSQIVEGLKK
jgi:hypothetical protein